jgi:hypothetical protein
LPTISLAPKEDESGPRAEEKFNIKGCWNTISGWVDLVKEWMKDADTSEIDSRGFQSILKKSIHFNNSRYRDILMSITLMSKENTVGMYIENLQDLAIIFDQMSPYVANFLEDCYLETDFCDNVQNADWHAGDDMKVFESNSSIINEQAANKEITDGDIGSGKGTGRQNRQISLKMLRVEFIFQ